MDRQKTQIRRKRNDTPAPKNANSSVNAASGASVPGPSTLQNRQKKPRTGRRNNGNRGNSCQRRARSAPNAQRGPMNDCVVMCCQPRNVGPRSLLDGANGTHIPISLYTSDTIAYGGAAGLVMQFNPWFPSIGALVTSNNPLTTINGVSLGSNTSATPDGNLFVPFACPAQFTANVPYVIGDNLDLWQAASIRFTGIRIKITNTTPNMFRCGVAQSYVNEMSVNTANETVTTVNALIPSTAYSTACQVRDIAGGTSIKPIGSTVYPVDGGISSKLPVSAVLTQNMATNPTISFFLKHTTKDFKFQPTPNVSFGIYQTVSPTNGGTPPTGPYPTRYNSMAIQGTAANWAATGYLFVDNDFQGVAVNFGSMSSGTTFNSFLVETFINLEVRPNSSSGFNTFAKPNTKVNAAAMNKIGNLPSLMEQKLSVSYDPQPR